MKRVFVSMTVLAALTIAVPAFAQVGRGLSGPHYNLNIIGVPHDKTAPMNNADRHTLFVPLQSGGDVGRQIRITYVAGDDFGIIDGNCTDDNACTIMVPSNPGFADPCYNVYAVGLGKPNGVAVVNAECALDAPLVDGASCTDALLLNSFTLKRTNDGGNKPKRVDITDIFRASGCLDLGADGTCDTPFANLWIFNIPQLLDYFWDYDNNGLKLMQLRFYPSTTCGSIGTS